MLLGRFHNSSIIKKGPLTSGVLQPRHLAKMTKLISPLSFLAFLLLSCNSCFILWRLQIFYCHFSPCSSLFYTVLNSLLIKSLCADRSDCNTLKKTGKTLIRADRLVTGPEVMDSLQGDMLKTTCCQCEARKIYHQCAAHSILLSICVDYLIGNPITAVIWKYYLSNSAHIQRSKFMLSPSASACSL